MEKIGVHPVIAPAVCLEKISRLEAARAYVYEEITPDQGKTHLKTLDKITPYSHRPRRVPSPHAENMEHWLITWKGHQASTTRCNKPETKCALFQP